VIVEEAGLLAKLRTAVGRPMGEPSAVPAAENEEAKPRGAGDQAEDGEPEFDQGIVGVLAEKVLNAWLRNRHQLLFPFALDLRRLDRHETELVIHAMIAAAQADGSVDGKERKRMEAALDLTEGSKASILDEILQHPKSLNEILAEAQDAKTGALIYAAALLAVDRNRPVNRYYLKYLAARLQLPDELVGSLRQRYRPAT
jgi:uncharacterized membrane protein YebE (DUF533 family)